MNDALKWLYLMETKWDGELYGIRRFSDEAITYEIIAPRHHLWLMFDNEPGVDAVLDDLTPEVYDLLTRKSCG